MKTFQFAILFSFLILFSKCDCHDCYKDVSMFYKEYVKLVQEDCDCIVKVINESANVKSFFYSIVLTFEPSHLEDLKINKYAHKANYYAEEFRKSSHNSSIELYFVFECFVENKNGKQYLFNEYVKFEGI